MNKISLLFFFLIWTIISCSNIDSKEDVIKKTIILVSNFAITINENPINNQSIGFIKATTNKGTLIFSLINQSPNSALSIDPATGELKILNFSVFDFEVNPVINATVKIESGNVFETANIVLTLNDVAEIINLQERLNNGETPYQIYQSDNSLLLSIYGLTYRGGIIFYLNITNGNGMIAAAFDQTDSVNFGCMGTNIFNAEHSGIGTGNTNTNSIVALCNQSSFAAKICYDLNLNGYTDWFLPSKDELNLMYVNLDANGLGSFNGWYWSSTEYQDQSNYNLVGYEAVWVQSFTNGANGLQVTYDVGIKSFNNHVRAIRNF